MRTTDLAKQLTSFLMAELPGVRNVSPNTILSYRDTYRQLLVYMNEQRGIKPEHLKIVDLSKDEITAFLGDIESKGNSISTRNQRLAAVHALFRYIQTRDTALLCLLYDSAARVQELADLKVNNIRLSPPPQVTLTGKGRKIRSVPLMDKTVSIIKAYMEENGLNQPEKKEQPLFSNARGEKLTRQGISYILKKYIDECHLAEISPHRLRHTKAMHLTEADINPFFIRDFLGHADIKTTGVYAKSSTKMKKAALEKINNSKQDPLPV